MNNTNHKVRRQSGFSLVELMVALVLGLILTSGVISVYISSKKTYSLSRAVGQVQENGRFTLGFMESPIRMAGYSGCNHNGKFWNDLAGGSTTSFDLSKAIEGYEYTGTGIGDSYTISTTSLAPANNAASWSPNLPSDVQTAIGGTGTGSVLAGSDIIVLHEASNNGFGLVSPYQDSAGVFVNPTDAAQLQVGELAVITDCQNSSLFQITAANISSGRVDHSNASLVPGNAVSNWNPGGKQNAQSYGAGAQLLFFNTYVFYIGKGVDGGPSLYDVTIGAGNVAGALGAPQELVSGVESMQVVYGVDTNGDKIPDNFQTADTITDWTKVVCVRIALLTRSDDASLDVMPSSAPSFIVLGNSDTDAANGLTLTSIQDRRLRKVFTETISIRNVLQ
ncbi:MAG TPA: PilW family protein [Gammaproteobacteria bacterium]|nr:PilW family protein [Gammaproteobacteria bacterium]